MNTNFLKENRNSSDSPRLTRNQRKNIIKSKLSTELITEATNVRTITKNTVEANRQPLLFKFNKNKRFAPPPPKTQSPQSPTSPPSSSLSQQDLSPEITNRIREIELTLNDEYSGSDSDIETDSDDEQNQAFYDEDNIDSIETVTEVIETVAEPVSDFFFSHTQKDCEKLVHEGYAYTLKNTLENGRIFWRCVNRNKTKAHAACPCVVSTQGKMTGFEYGIHEHVCGRPDITLEDTERSLMDIMNRAVSSNDAPRTIIHAGQLSLNDLAASKMTRHRNLARKIQYKRNKNIVKSVVAKKKEELVVPEEYKIAKKAKPDESDKLFLLFDTGPLDPFRIVAFATLLNLVLLAANLHWFGDGTFSIR